MSDLALSIRLTADGKDLVGAVKVSSDELDKMGAATKRATSEAEKLNTAQKNLGESLNAGKIRQYVDIAKGAFAEHSRALAQVQSDYEYLIIPASAINSLETWKEKSAYLIGAGVAIGIDKAKEAWDSFTEWIKEKAKMTGVIWGAALVTGIAAAALTAVYAAYKSIGFGIGLLTGESYKSTNIDALVAMNKEIKTLQANLPLTAVGASALNEALKQQGTSAAGYAQTLGSVNAAQRTNGEELDRLGVKYKDQNGNLLDTKTTLASAAAVLATYASGWDREQAAAAIAMGTEKQIQDALAATAEKIAIAKDRLIAYGLIIGEGTQEAVTQYEDAMRAFDRELDLTSQGFKRAIADNVMPLLTQFAEFFRDGFPTAVMTFRYSIATVMSLFYGLKTVVYLVAE